MRGTLVPFPGRLVNGAVAAAAGVDWETDPWLPERSVWPLLEVVESSIGEAWLAPLGAHLAGPGSDADPPRCARRLSSVRHMVAHVRTAGELVLHHFETVGES